MNKVIGKDTKYKFLDVFVAGLFIVIYSSVTFTLFYRQTDGTSPYYPADLPVYMLEMQGIESGCYFPYPLFFKVGALILKFIGDPRLSITLALVLLNAITPIAIKYYMQKILKKQKYLGNQSTLCESKQFLLKQAVTILTFLILFVSMLYPPAGYSLPGIGYKYAGVFSPNPFHNATYIATRSFAVLTFFKFVEILQEYEKNFILKDAILFSTFLFLTTMTKPSFTFVLVPAAGLIMLYRMCNSKFENFIPTMKLGLCFIPTFIVLIYQFCDVFVAKGQEEAGIGFGLATAWGLYCRNIPLAICLALAFPILVLFFHGKLINSNTIYRFSWQLLGVSLFEVLFLYQKGIRLPDMNFAWGYMHSMSFLFISSTLVLLEDTLNFYKEKKYKIKIRLLSQWILLGLHVICGICYFINLFEGNHYY